MSLPVDGRAGPWEAGSGQEDITGGRRIAHGVAKRADLDARAKAPEPTQPATGPSRPGGGLEPALRAPDPAPRSPEQQPRTAGTNPNAAGGNQGREPHEADGRIPAAAFPASTRTSGALLRRRRGEKEAGRGIGGGGRWGTARVAPLGDDAGGSVLSR